MAVKRVLNIETFTGASGDSKPTGVPPGSIFYEYDTYKKYETYDGTNWVDMSRKLSILDSTIGANGGTYIDDTSANTPGTGYSYFAIQALEDVVIDSVTGNIDIGSATITEGNIVYGSWSSITLTSGKCIAYKKVT
jgi:hypothetical protein